MHVKLATASRAALAAALLLVASCASKPVAPRLVTPPSSSAPGRFTVAEADALAARGCYICLQEAAAAYGRAGEIGDDPFVLLKKTLENRLMLAIREIELRIPDSGAREQAYQLRQHVKGNYDAYFTALDLMKKSVGARATTSGDVQRERTARMETLKKLEGAWPTSQVAAYFYLALELSSGSVRDIAEEPQTIAQAHPQRPALTYRLQAYPPAFDAATAAELLAAEPRFAEVQFVTGQRAMSGGDLGTARRELLAAHTALPDSLAVTSALAAVELALARYGDALALFEDILQAGPDPSAQLGRAETLSHLMRYREAIADLDELLEDPSWNPGAKYYWRAWNKLQLRQPADEDATTALRFMSSAAAFRLAGIATFNLPRPAEARAYFESALTIDSADCDSIRYLGLLDISARDWSSAAARFGAASGCYRQSIERLSAELAEKQKDSSGLFIGQIAGLYADLVDARSMQEMSAYNAEISEKNAASGRPPSP